MQKQIYFGILALIFTLSLSHCSTTEKASQPKDQTTFSAIQDDSTAEDKMMNDLPGEKNQTATMTVTPVEPKDPEILESRIHQLEAQMAGLLKKIKQVEDENGRLRKKLTEPEAKAIREPIVDQIEDIPPNHPSRLKQDDAIEAYRTAMIYFKGKKYSNAILEFTKFVNQNNDHVLSGSAQFHIGESYFEQNELKLAKEEYKRVLVSYEKSNVVPEALLKLSIVHSKLGDSEDADRYKQQLLSLFPHSPSASQVMNQTEVKQQINTINEEDLSQFEIEDDIDKISNKMQKANEIIERSKQVTQQQLEPPTAAIPE